MTSEEKLAAIQQELEAAMRPILGSRVDEQARGVMVAAARDVLDRYAEREVVSFSGVDVDFSEGGVMNVTIDRLELVDEVTWEPPRPKRPPRFKTCVYRKMRIPMGSSCQAAASSYVPRARTSGIIPVQQ